MKKDIKSVIKEKITVIKQMKKRDKIIWGGSILAAVLIIFFSFSIFKKVEHERIVKVSGNIEGDEIRISFRVEGQIEKLIVDEGYYVNAGDPVAKLKEDELMKTRDEAGAALKSAEYKYELAKLDYIRAENLFKEGSISTQARDDAKTKADAAHADMEQDHASLALSETRLGFTNLVSPLNGYILTKSSLQGEVVKPGATVFTAIDLNNIWVTAYINEKDLGRVKLDQKAYVRTDTYPHKRYRGWVSFISQETEFTPKYIQTTEERVKYVYRIKVRVDNSSLDLKPGMPADAYILVD